LRKGFDRLVALRQQEIQVGVLKRLRGTNIIRHTETYDMRYTPYAPYTILATDRIDFTSMQRLVRFARYWDLVANSGRFPQALPLLLGDSPFATFPCVLRLALCNNPQDASDCAGPVVRSGLQGNDRMPVGATDRGSDSGGARLYFVGQQGDSGVSKDCKTGEG